MTLQHIQEALAAGKQAEALAQLHHYLEQHENAEAHRLHCELLLSMENSNATTMQNLATSLCWLREQQDPQASSYWAQTETLIRKTLEQVADKFKEALHFNALEPIDDLHPLAPLFPMLYLARADLMMQLEETLEGNRFRYRMVYEIWEKYQEKLREAGYQELLADHWLGQAKGLLLQVMQQLPPQHELYQVALLPLAQLCIHNEEWLEAAQWYHQVIDQGWPLEKLVQQEISSLAKQLLPLLYDYFDECLQKGRFARIQSLLRRKSHLQALPMLQLQRLDARLLKGESGPLEKRYRAHLEASPPPLDMSLDLARELFSTVVAIGPELKAVNLSQGGLPYQIYGLVGRNVQARAGAGLLSHYQKTENFNALRALALQLLEKSSGGNDYLITLVEECHRKQFQEDFASLHQAAWDALQQQDWASAAERFQKLVGHPHHSALDKAYWVIASHAAGQSQAALLYQLEQVPPATWGSVELKLLTGLLDSLSALEAWPLLDAILPNLALQPAQQQHYQQQRETYLATAKAALAQHLNKRDFASARPLAAALQQLIPQDEAFAYLHVELLMALGHWSAARQRLEQLPPSPESSLRLAEIDLQEGRIHDSKERLRHLEGLGNPAQMRELQQHLSQQPFILLRRLEDGLWHAFFAVEVTGIHLAKEVSAFVDEGLRFLVSLHRASHFEAQPSFAWRYLGQGTATKDLSLALLCRVESSARSSAQAMAEKLWQVMAQTLPLRQQQVYQYQPVYRRARLEALLEPLVIQQAVQIVRAESHAQAQDKLYKVEALHPHLGNLHQTLNLLLQAPGTTVLDICFHPTTIMPWENEAILSMLLASGNAGDPAHNPQHYPIALDELQQARAHHWFNENNLAMLNSLETMAFEVHIHLASSQAMNPAMPDLIALDLLGTSPYRITRTLTPDEQQIVARNLYQLRGEAWGFPAAPHGLERWRYLFSLGETLMVAHLPVPGPQGVPGLPLMPVRTVAMPSSLPEAGVTLGESLIPVQGRLAPLRVSPVDRLRHIYIVGRTGTGKSTLLQNMALQDIEAGYGVGIIDPHGELVEDVLARIPSHRQQDVVLFDPADTTYPVGLNILDVEGSYEQSIVVSDFIGLMYQIFDPNRTGMVGPRFENMVRNAMLAVMEIQDSTFIEVVRLMTDSDYREACLKTLQDPIVKAYWEDIARDVRSWDRGEMLDYVTSKFGRFNNDRLMRNIIGQSRNTINFRQVMNEGKILLINLAKGRIGPENSHFLGLILIPQLLIAAMSRAHLGARQRRMFCLYVDEFHNFTTPAFGTMLSEARKYGVALTLANQFISQLSNTTREAVFGNVGTLLSFRVGIQDAHFLAQEFYPVYGESDLINLPNYYAIAKMLLNGNSANPFPLHTLPGLPINPAIDPAELRAASQMRYGRDVALIERELALRFERPPQHRQPAFSGRQAERG